MTFYANSGYFVTLRDPICPDGVIIQCGAVSMPKMQSRFQNKKYSKLTYWRKRLFDPQIYMAKLDATESSRYCANLATYPWFQVPEMDEYRPTFMEDDAWDDFRDNKIKDIWPRQEPVRSEDIYRAVSSCVEFQIGADCEAVILPSPLTVSPTNGYSQEIMWLHIGLDYIEERKVANYDVPWSIPIYATLAISDSCLRYDEPLKNRFLERILDNLCDSDIQGVYIVLEQGSESVLERQCGNINVLSSILHIIHVLSHNGKLRVVINFMGVFGLACIAAGADVWASGWYRSLYRCRLADKITMDKQYGAWPSYWSYQSATDINLGSDFDFLAQKGILNKVADKTEASKGLLEAISRGEKVNDVPQWVHRVNNVSSAMDHFTLSAIRSERDHQAAASRLDAVQTWLNQALEYTNKISDSLKKKKNSNTQTSHVQAWRDAFVAYRKDHDC